MRLALEDLDQELRRAYLALAVFPEDLAVPTRAIERLWAPRGHTAEETKRMLGHLAERRLLTQVSGGAHRVAAEPEPAAIAFHDLQREFLLFSTEPLLQAHGDLLGAYQATLTVPGDWASLPEGEPYIWDHLIAHLIGAGEIDQARATLCDLAFLGRRIGETSALGAEADLGALAAPLPGDEVMRQLATRLRQWGSTIEAQRGSVGFVSTLHARLGAPGTDDSGLDRLASGPWFRHRWGLSEEAGALLRVLDGHQHWVTAVAFSPDGARLASGWYDRSVRVWDAARLVELTRVVLGKAATTVAWSGEGVGVGAGRDVIVFEAVG